MTRPLPQQQWGPVSVCKPSRGRVCATTNDVDVEHLLIYFLTSCTSLLNHTCVIDRPGITFPLVAVKNTQVCVWDGKCVRSNTGIVKTMYLLIISSLS